MTSRCPCSCLPVSPLLCCPVGAGAAVPGGDVVDLGEDDAVDKEHALFGDPIVGQDDVHQEEPEALEAVAVQTPKGMTAAQWAKHRLTHLPYCDGCPICAAARRPNTQHRATHESDRIVPLLVGDYCFLKSATDSKHLTTLVLRLMPSKTFFCHRGPCKGFPSGCHCQNVTVHS